ncbi:MAG TPA: hypothetical protein DCQ97_09415 [Chitinophagaceae bacterium]|nr:hypothetical protein [Chitinophagaceae bacterium]
MKKIFFFLCCICSHSIFACTTFCIQKDGQIVFGRNYDWITGAGIVNTNQRGLFKTSMQTGNGNTASWISKYGSITFNQYGKEFPTGGMNEKGLVVELMWLDGTVYPGNDARAALGVLQWIQYQLDNAATVAEVIASDGSVRISEKGTPLHYLIADAAGNVATIEFLNGRLTVHQGKELPFPVLTNNTYASSVKTAMPLVDRENISLPDNSLERFTKACRMVKRYQENKVSLPLTDYAFSILDEVSQGSFTKWSIVYDISNKKILFKTEANRSVKSVDFSAFDFTCSLPSKMFNMNQGGKGNISTLFILPDKRIRQQVMQQAVTESAGRVHITTKEQEDLLNFEYGVKCKL